MAATACSSPPAGRARWTLELLADALVKVTTHESLSRETAPRRLAENKLKPWRKDMGCIPRSTRIASPAWRTCSISTPKRPTRSGLCFDESPIELIGETRLPIPAKPGQIERYDCEHRRNGTANLFVFLDVNRPGRKGKVTERRAAEDFATCMARTRRGSLSRGGAHPRGARQSVDPFARRPPPDLSGQRSLTGAASTGVPLCPQARKLAEQGGDRDGVLASQCLDRRIESYARLVAETAAWEKRRNAERARIKWMVTTRKSARQNGPRLSEACMRIRLTSKSETSVPRY